MTPVPLIHTTRGYGVERFVENIHAGSVAVVDVAGKLRWFAGDPHHMTFTRSTLKPFQALPFVRADGPARFALAPSELALLCASHSGEERHVAGVAAILAKIGMDESALACGCHVPLFYDTCKVAPPAGRVWSQLHHNCSGKHSGFLAWCRLHDVAPAGYVDPAHPLQQEIVRSLSATTGLPRAQLPSGQDGCSAPNYALPLSRLAHLYARLAQGAADARLGAAMGDLFDAMTNHPDLVSGTGRTDLAFMQAGNGDWVSKAGADGTQVIGVRSAGLGIAIKIADGAARAVAPATVSALRQLDLMGPTQWALLQQYVAPAITNMRGAAVGDVRAVFQLNEAGNR